MSLIEWSIVYSVGVKDIDMQHMKLIELANQLDEALKTGRDKEELGAILVELVRYTQYHFAFEERLMEKHRYSRAGEHHQEHVELVKTVEDFKSRFDSGDPSISAQVMSFLRDWLTRHILNSDRALGNELNAKGVH